MGHCPTARSANNADDLSFTILWSPLPLITWFFPFIGHLGIADSRGIASDFQGPYSVGDRGRMAFGPPTRALKIDINSLEGKRENPFSIPCFGAVPAARKYLKNKHMDLFAVCVLLIVNTLSTVYHK